MVDGVAANQLDVRCSKISKPKCRWIASKKSYRKPITTENTKNTEFFHKSLMKLLSG
jgi:hypothetical protein